VALLLATVEAMVAQVARHRAAAAVQGGTQVLVVMEEVALVEVMGLAAEAAAVLVAAAEAALAVAVSKFTAKAQMALARHHQV
jgi:hypothetical protein